MRTILYRGTGQCPKIGICRTLGVIVLVYHVYSTEAGTFVAFDDRARAASCQPDKASCQVPHPIKRNITAVFDSLLHFPGNLEVAAQSGVFLTEIV